MDLLIARGTIVHAASALACVVAVGCVFDDQCVAGAERNQVTGRCELMVHDGSHSDGGHHGSDGGRSDGGGSDSGACDGGMDAGGPPRIVDFAVGGLTVCAIDDRGVLRCWGSNAFGALATGNIAAHADAVVVDLGAPVTTVNGSALHTCATTSAPATFCWGANDSGQIGNGAPSADPVTMPFALAGLGTLREIAAGFANTCAVGLATGTRCWGRDDQGQLGIGTVGTDLSAPGDPVQHDNGSPYEGIRSAAIGDRFICFHIDTNIYCVGENNDGQIGDGPMTQHSWPIPAVGLASVTDIAAAFSHTCAVDSGQVYCWGHGDAGQVVPGETGSYTTPMLVDLGGDAVQVVTGQAHTCALMVDGSVQCWGMDDTGALGDAATHTGAAGPVAVEGLSGITRLSANLLAATCALDSDGQLFCWGRDAAADLGGSQPGGTTLFLDGETQHDTPVRVDPL